MTLLMGKENHRLLPSPPSLIKVRKFTCFRLLRNTFLKRFAPPFTKSFPPLPRPVYLHCLVKNTHVTHVTHG